jgi:hypothetical protein
MCLKIVVIFYISNGYITNKYPLPVFFNGSTPLILTHLIKIYGDTETLQADLDTWLAYYNTECTH